ncbi:MAG: N-acetylmuramoyl-L-alanine amidase [Ferruginibacter sp.]
MLNIVFNSIHFYMNIFNRIITILLASLLLNACSPKPYAATNKIYKENVKKFSKIIQAQPIDSVKADSVKYPRDWAGTTNFGMRKPNFVILHHTAQNSCEETLKTFTLQRTQVSSHYIICKDGTLHHMLNDYLRAWHAGSSKWGNLTDINSASIGIEIDNNGKDTFSLAQINTLLGLLGNLKKAHVIPSANFIGHGDIAPGRKVDPNVTFPWRQLADSGYGLWYTDTTNIIVPSEFNAAYALRIIGYDVSRLNQAIEAFRRHFLQSNTQGELLMPEKKILYNLMQRYL